MAVVTCEKCGKVYDDTYRWTICPHEEFGMAATANRPDGTVGIATTVQQVGEIHRGER